jgi:hypothetical protein
VVVYGRLPFFTFYAIHSPSPLVTANTLAPSCCHTGRSRCGSPPWTTFSPAFRHPDFRCYLILPYGRFSIGWSYSCGALRVSPKAFHALSFATSLHPGRYSGGSGSSTLMATIFETPSPYSHPLSVTPTSYSTAQYVIIFTRFIPFYRLFSLPRSPPSLVTAMVAPSRPPSLII